MSIKRIKLHETERVRIIMSSSETPIVDVFGPDGIDPVFMSIHPEPLNSIAQGGAHDNAIGATSLLYAWAGCFVPDRVGQWTVVVETNPSSGDDQAIVTQTIEYDCQYASEAEQRLGISRTPKLLTSIGNVAIDSSGELSTSYGVPSNCTWLSTSLVTDDYAACNWSQAYLPTGDKWSVWGNRTNATRIKYDGLVTGFRLMMKGYNPSSYDFNLYFLVLQGDVDACSLRGMSELIDTSRLDRAYVSGEAWTETTFENPVPAKKGDWVAIAVYNNLGGTQFPLTSLCIASAHCFTDISKKTDGVITDEGGDIYTIVSAGSTFETWGVRGYDEDTTHTSYVRIMESEDATPYQQNPFRVDSVVNETTLTISDVKGDGLTNGYIYDFCVTTGYTDAETLGGAVLAQTVTTTMIQGLVNGDTFDMSPTESQQATYKGSWYTIDPIMDAPTIALTGDSIMSGTDTSGNENGNHGHDHHLSQRPHDDDLDISHYLSKMLGVPCVNAAVGGANLRRYIGGAEDYAWRYGVTQELASALSYKPGIIIHMTMTNDCTISTFNTKATYTKYLDKLHMDCVDNEVTLVMTTGIPVPGRDAEDQARAKKLRRWLREWAANTSVRLIDTAAFLQPSWDTDEKILTTADNIGTHSFPDHGQTLSDVHLRPAGTKALARIIGEELLRPTEGALVRHATSIEMIAGAPPATPTPEDALMYIYMWLRNNTQATDTERRILDDSGTIIAKATITDDGTTTQQGKLGAP